MQRKNKIFQKVGTRLAIMNFKLGVVSKENKIELKGNGETRKFLTKTWNSEQTNRRIGSLVWSPICGEVKF